MDVGYPVFRAMRAAIFAAVCVAVSATLHRLASPEPIGALAILGGILLVGLGAYALADRTRGPIVITLACATGQLFLHLLFNLGATGTHSHASPTAMVLLHLAAAGASAAWLTRGETALATFVDYLCMWLCPILLRFISTYTITRPQIRVFNSVVMLPPRTAEIVLAAPRRGPPAPFASF